jgi:hypothetical protein
LRRKLTVTQHSRPQQKTRISLGWMRVSSFYNLSLVVIGGFEPLITEKA